MLLVAKEPSSAELEIPLQRLGIPAEKTHLDFGDFALIGRGIGGKQVMVGVEMKKVKDLIGSLRTQRLQGHQAPGMLATYDYRYLLVEGETRIDKHGLICMRGKFGRWTPVRSSMTIMELEERILTLVHNGGFHFVRTTNTRRDSLFWLASLYYWWTDRDMDEHKSHIGIHTPSGVVPLTRFRKAVYALPGIGLKTSLAAQKQFRSLRRAIGESEVKDWAELVTTGSEGRSRRLGEKEAARIIEEIDREY